MPTKQQIDEFKAAFKLLAATTHKKISWDSGLFKKQTSLAPVVSAMEAFEEVRSAEHLNRIYTAISEAHLKKDRYRDDLDQLKNDLDAHLVNENNGTRTLVNNLLAKLKANVYAAHVNTEIGQIETLINAEHDLTTASQHKEAFVKLDAAKKKIIEANDKFLDKYAPVRAKWATARAKYDLEAANYKNGLPGRFTRWDNQIKQAKNHIKPENREYSAADTKLEDALDGLKGEYKTYYLDGLEDKINKLKEDNTPVKAKVKSYLTSLLSGIDDSFNALKVANDAGESKKIFLERSKLFDLLTEAKKLGERRQEFETQLIATELAIAGLDEFSAVKVIKDKQDALKDPGVKNAKDVASIEKRQIEIGVDKLKEIEAEAKTLKTYGAACKTYATEAPKVQTAFDNDIKEHANKNEAIVSAIKGLIDQATELAKDPVTTAAANTLLEQAKRDTAAAKTAFDVSKDLAGIQNVDANGAGDALQKLKDNYKTAKGHSDKSAAQTELSEFVSAYGEDLVTLDGKVTRKDDGYLDGLKGAATALDTILLILSQQAGYKADLEKLENRKGTLNSATEKPNILAKITALEGAITILKEKHAAKDWAARASALKGAEEKAAEAEEALESRKKYDNRVKSIAGSTSYDGGRLNACNLATDPKKEVTDLLDEAKGFADNPTLKFDDANKKLDAAVAKMEELYAKKQLPNPERELSNDEVNKIKEAAQKLIDNGSEKELDKLIQSIPDKAGKKVIQELAKIRYGFTFEVEPMTVDSIKKYYKKKYNRDLTDLEAQQKLAQRKPEEEATRAAKRMLKMIALVPDHAKDNPSMETVKRLEPFGGAGGYYSPSSNLVVMESRPDYSPDQKFGATADELPVDDIDEKYQAVNNTSVDYFDWATLHEVGHAVDDNLGFMSQRLDQSKFGGWQVHGGNVDPIAKKLAKKFKVAEWEQEIKNFILGKPVTWPTDAPASASPKSAADLKQEIIDWYKVAAKDENAWWYQDKCEHIALDGRVYQQAYTNTWVSYPLEERKNGLTGYQFRAPGEWFAELYAAYHFPVAGNDSGKLKSSHPAVKWLKDLKTS